MMKYNTTSIMGYSAFWDNGLVDFCSHSCNDHMFPYDRYKDSLTGVWIFVPIDHGERITEIWKQEPESWQYGVLGVRVKS